MVLKSLSLSCTESTAAARPTLIAPPKIYKKTNGGFRSQYRSPRKVTWINSGMNAPSNRLHCDLGICGKQKCPDSFKASD